MCGSPMRCELRDGAGGIWRITGGRANLAPDFAVDDKDIFARFHATLLARALVGARVGVTA